MRALEGARVFKLIGARMLIVSGGIPRPDRQFQPESEILREVVIKVGVPPDAVVEESRSKTTRDQALLVGPILRANNIHRFVLVTSPTHMRRSLALFRAVGLDPVPSMSPIRSDGVPRRPWLLPNYESFAISDEATYDYAAGMYYWALGWTR